MVSTPIKAAYAMFIAMGFLVLCPSIATAEDSPQKLEITWQQIVQAVDNHALLKQQEIQQRIGEAGIREARAIPNPTVELSIARGKAKETDETALEWGASLTVPLDWIATRNAAVRAAQAESNIVESDQALLRKDVIAALRRLFWHSVYQQEKTKFLEQLLRETTSLTRLIQKRVESGDARPTELSRIRIEQEKVALALTAARMEMTACQSEIGLWMGEKGPIHVNSTLSFTTDNAPQASAAQVASHPAIEGTRRQIDAADARIQREKRHRFPEMALNVFAENELDKTALGAGVAVSVPLWNFNDGAIERAQAEKAARQAEMDVQQFQLERRRLQANASCRRSYHLAKEFASRVLPEATDVAARVARAYALGEATLIDVLDARRSLLDTRTELLDAQLQARLDCSDVQNLTGEEKQ